jgi:TRAP-type C4-dicarboxylate transport system substrate-binding protein
MRIKISVAGNQPDYERKTVRYVRAGKAQLGSVGVRVWDTMGVTSLRALVAPFLIDSLALQQRVLQSARVAPMLERVNRAGVVGLAVLPGPLRRPLGLSRPLIGPQDYRGATIAIRFGGVTRATFEALGAMTKGYVVGHLPALDGAELDLNTIAENGYDVDALELTANVVLWPLPQTIFANRDVFERLTPAQQQILLRAGRSALGPELARVAKDELQGLSAVCGRAKVSLESAAASDLAALRQAVRPVYDQLEQDPSTRKLIGEITKLRGALPTDVVRCSRAASRTEAASRLEGLWQVTTSRQDLLAAGTPPSEAERQRGTATLALKGGRWIARERHSGFVWRGRYAVQGNVLRLSVAACQGSNDVCFLGATTEYTWSVYRDRLSLDRVSGTVTYYGLIAKPLTRVR